MSSPKSPSEPVNIRAPRPRPAEPGQGSFSATSTPIGTPDLRALRAQYAAIGTPANIPPRGGTPFQSGSPGVSLGIPSRSQTPRPAPAAGGISASKSAATPGGDPSIPVMDLEDLPEEEKIKVLRRHLVSKDERLQPPESEQQEGDAGTGTPNSSRSSSGASSGKAKAVVREDTETFPVPYHAPGADVTHDIYRWQSNQRRLAIRSRAASFSGLPKPADPVFEHIHEPGGFRRNFVLLRANEQGMEEPRMLNNFVDFLFIFGHFAGEDLEEDEDEDEEDEEAAVAGPSSARPSVGFGDLSEESPLLGKSSSLSRSRSRSRRRASSLGPRGNATVPQAVLMLLKAFIGTGVLFLGRAFYNGGILFSSFLFVVIAAVSLLSFLLLVETKFVVSGSFGDIGGALYGPWMRNMILASIVVSQIGFVGAYMIFVAENLQAFVLGATNCVKLIPVRYFIAAQTLVFLPLSLIRDLAKLSGTALVADAFILVGLIYIFGTEIGIVARRGIADVALFNPRDFPLFVGTAVFSFEGIGLVIPITDAMREPKKFPAVITGVMFFLVLLFGGAGVLAYLTFGSDIQTVVLVNLDTTSKMVQSVQFIYSLAIMLSVPLQLFPAVRIMENGLFIRSGKADPRVKWLKNCFRFATVLFCMVISTAGAADLDKFVAFVGCFACVPLCYVYPAMLHYKACAHTKKQKVIDLMMIGFGLLAAAYTTMQTIRLMIEPHDGGSSRLGNCVPQT